MFVIVVAAGRGERAKLEGPKQYHVLAGKTVLTRTLEAVLARNSQGLVVIHEDDRPLYDQAIAALDPALVAKLLPPAIGADTRQGSVLAGLKALQHITKSDDIVLIHDAARPFVSQKLIENIAQSARLYGAAIPVLPIIDTLKCKQDINVTNGPDRSSLCTAQTPQGFVFGALLSAHEAAEGRIEATDDSAVMEAAGHTVHAIPGEKQNIKLTTPDDFEEAHQKLMMFEPRTGFGFDVHRLTKGDHIWLGGIKIPHDQEVLAHSDGDVILHALTDAILGTMADGDIGVHFPPSDPQWKGASSDQFLSFAAGKLKAKGGRITLLDITLLAEAPRLTPYRDILRARIAVIAGIEIERVSLKATTTETLGFTGRREGIAAQAIATVMMPWSLL
jgi:2-C-methyl-D-erythritol 4-phosphate cytidylyltransferase / 2-C-methyl-D-erythritol 2,4-cyclodiphosphate synthase